MTEIDIGWQTLNAYVDGELDAQHASEVARAVAEAPEIARQVFLISRLKAATAASAEPPPKIVVPRRARRWRPAIAAAIAVVLAGGVAALFTLGPAPPREEAWLARARADHAAWANAARIDAGEKLDARSFLVAMSRLGPTPYLADLSSARLTLESVRFIPAAENRAGTLHAGYVGTRGCRISLWITSSAEHGVGPLARHGTGAAGAYSWFAGGLRYVLLSSGMDPARFALIARAVHKTSAERASPGPETRAALAQSRKSSPPCKG